MFLPHPSSQHIVHVKLNRMWFVYILLCKDGSFYTGITNNLQRRFIQHRNGTGGRYTRSHKPVNLIYHEQFKTHSDALKREFEIKSRGRKKKVNLVFK